jgi:hypothetical protein
VFLKVPNQMEGRDNKVGRLVDTEIQHSQEKIFMGIG